MPSIRIGMPWCGPIGADVARRHELPASSTRTSPVAKTLANSASSTSGRLALAERRVTRRPITSLRRIPACQSRALRFQSTTRLFVVHDIQADRQGIDRHAVASLANVSMVVRCDPTRCAGNTALKDRSSEGIEQLAQFAGQTVDDSDHFERGVSPVAARDFDSNHIAAGTTGRP